MKFSFWWTRECDATSGSGFVCAQLKKGFGKLESATGDWNASAINNKERKKVRSSAFVPLADIVELLAAFRPPQVAARRAAAPARLDTTLIFNSNGRANKRVSIFIEWMYKVI